MPVKRLLIQLVVLFACLGNSVADVGIRVDASHADRLRNLDLNPLVDLTYSSFRWIVLSAGDSEKLRSDEVHYELIASPYVLDLGGISFDPIEDEINLPPGWQGIGTASSDLFLVQAKGPIQPAWLDDLRDRGFDVVVYIHPFTYVVWGPPEARSLIREHSWVRWTGEFAPAFRVLPRWRNLPVEPVVIDIMIYTPSGLERILKELSVLGAILEPARRLDHRFSVCSGTLSGMAFIEAAKIPGVYSIQPQPTEGGLRGEMSCQVNAGNVGGENLAYPGYASWLASRGLSGANVIMANVDGGFDDEHIDLIARVAPCTGSTCGHSTMSVHGTHTAGLMVADATSFEIDGFGFLRGMGVAPGATLVEQLDWPFYADADGLLMLIQQSFDNGAILSSNSWGPSNTPLGYDNDTMQVDIGVRDADPETPGNQDFAYILAIMNGFGGVSTQGTPDEAKNTITVGSSRLRDVSGYQTTEINNLSASSAHGPALDGRFIPHLVAPGCSVDSTFLDDTWGLNCGTSMASPQVAGAAALFIEYFRNLSGANSTPSPALIKAALVSATHDLYGANDANGQVMGHRFDNKQGWGRLDIAATVDPETTTNYFDEPIIFDETGSLWSVPMTIDDPAQPVRIMLAWTDAPGHGLGGTTPAWNNDLDLIVERNETAYYGNVLGAAGWSISAINPDPKNNTEGVFFGPGTSGALTVTVRATNISSDGIPSHGDDTDQDFSLVVRNASPLACTKGPTFASGLDVTESSILGAQVYHLRWSPASACGGSVWSTVYAGQGIGQEPALLTRTTASSIDLLGAPPGQVHCFTVELSENGIDGTASGQVCLPGTADRIAGDVNCDGDITTDDLMLLVGTLFGASENTCAGYESSDANLDGLTNAEDIAQLLHSIDDPL